MNPDDPNFISRQFGINLARARVERGFSQGVVAKKSGYSQQLVSKIESGSRPPTLPEILRFAQTLKVPIHRLITGEDRPGANMADLAIELENLGITDLWVRDSIIPGAFRRPEEVINLAIDGHSPDPRIVESMPVVLAWSRLDHRLLSAYAAECGTTHRLAWLADLTLALDLRYGFPGGCQRSSLQDFVEATSLPSDHATWDDLGKGSEQEPSSPIWRRWRIRYDARIKQFFDRAKVLASLRDEAREYSTRRSRLVIPIGEAGSHARSSAREKTDQSHKALNRSESTDGKS